MTQRADVQYRLRCQECDRQKYVNAVGQTEAAAGGAEWLSDHYAHKLDTPTRRLASIARSCLNKRVYPTRRLALRAAARVATATGQPGMDPYPCGHCALWHLSSQRRPRPGSPEGDAFAGAVERHGPICVNCSSAEATVAVRDRRAQLGERKRRLPMCDRCACSQPARIASIDEDGGSDGNR